MRSLLRLLSPALWIFRLLGRSPAHTVRANRLRLLLGLVLLPILATVGMFIGFAFLWVLAWKRLIAKPTPLSEQKSCDDVLEAEYRVLRKSRLPKG